MGLAGNEWYCTVRGQTDGQKTDRLIASPASQSRSLASASPTKPGTLQETRPSQVPIATWYLQDLAPGPQAQPGMTVLA